MRRFTDRREAGRADEVEGKAMEFGLHPGVICALAIALFLALHVALRWPLPLAFLVVAIASALIGDFGVPFRHLVEGGFGFINLILALFAGAFFGHMMRASGAADAAAAGIVCAAGGRVLPVLALAGLPLFVVGMFVGLAGVAVLSAGVFAVPALRRVGYEDATIAAFIAVMATAGMIAPPMNVPALLIADGVNMPWTNVNRALLALALPLAAAALVWFTWGCGPGKPRADEPIEDAGDASNIKRECASPSFAACVRGFAPLVVIVAIWIAIRVFPTVLIDPASPLILVIGGLIALPLVPRTELGKAVMATFSGTPLLLAAVLVTVGILVQIMTLTGVRGWLVISTMSLTAPWNYPSLLLGMPLLGGALTSMSVADVIGVPAAFSFIGQDMILNVAALSAIASLAEFVPPTSIASALACYVVGGGTVGQVFRRAWPPMAVLAALALLMLVFARQLAGVLT
jgi:gluconate:H+ symporter, GntP family